MKKVTFTALFSLVLWVGTLSAQFSMGALSMPGRESKKTPIDKLQFIIQYEMAFVQDISKPDEVTEETMILKVGERTSQFYSYTKFVSDSLFRIQMAQSDGIMMRRESSGSGGGSANQGQVNYQIYKNHPAGKVTTLERIGPSQFRCEETNVCPEWQVLPDTATILNYLCYKATTHFKGRDYTAWFTLQIPRSEGPWKLCGLPGLILYAADSRQHYVFECTGLLNARPDETIDYGADTFEPVSRQALNRTYERFAADPIGYITASSPNIQVRFRNAEGSDIKPTNIPYNPIELSE
ncbi:MAG: GLPGLI family protein [Tannerella sp.]|jgi:GLPGLI family protein|nr:GLPGLI family protein [Tannerella sp.]